MGKQTPQKFLEAVQLLIEKKAIDPTDMLLRFIGSYDENILRIFQRFNAQMPIEILDFQPYEKSLYHQINSDLLLLIVSTDTKKAGPNQTMTGKFFEYIGARRPIFALVPDGPLKNIIIRGKFGQVAPPQDPIEIGARLLTLYKQWKSRGKLIYHPNAQIKNKFRRKALTGDLAAVIRQVVR